MRKIFAAALMLFAFSFLSSPALAHFGMVIPSTPVVEEKKDATLSLELSFSHPMEMVGMPLAKPKSFTVHVDGKAQDLVPSLAPAKILDHEAWKAQYTVKRPGVYWFAMEPVPYWEPVEDCYIVHYTKTVVAAFGEEEGWDRPLARAVLM